MEFQTLGAEMNCHMGYCHYTILQVRETKLTEKRSCPFHMELSDGARFESEKSKSKAPHYLPLPSSIGGEHKEVYKIRVLI